MTNPTVALLVKKAELKIEKIATSLLASYDLTSRQLKILNILYASEDRQLRQIDLEHHFALTNPTVTGILNNMEKKGLIRRVKNPEDNRSNVIVLTDEALEKKNEMIALYHTLEETLTSSLTANEKETLIALLAKLIGGEWESTDRI